MTDGVAEFSRGPIPPSPAEDARRLIAQYGDDACVQARFFVLLEREGVSIDRPLGHWSAVEREIVRILTAPA